MLKKFCKIYYKGVVYYKNGFTFAVVLNTYCKYTTKLLIVVIIITESVIMERYCMYFCLVLGTVFLVMAFLIAWKYLFSMGLCYATAFLATETREH